MIEKSIILKSHNGLHARPASELVKLANSFESDIFIENNNNKVNAKSIMGLLTLAAVDGSELTIYVDGTDEQEALNAIVEFLLNLKK